MIGLDRFNRATANAAHTEKIGERVGEVLRAGDLVVLTGDLGAGKTTFAKGVARGLGVTEIVTSPTFTIVQEYEGRVPVAHIDVYRLDRVQELHDLGFDEMLDDRVVLVEWGDSVERALPLDRLEVRFTMEPGSGELRGLEFICHGPRWQAHHNELTTVTLVTAGP